MTDYNQDIDGPGFDMECNLNFLDEIEQYDNPDSCDKSDANTSSKSISSRSENKQPNCNEKQMVMIDQKQLLELMEAKRILEAQKIASASAQLATSRKNTNDLIGAAFSNGLFNHMGCQEKATPNNVFTYQENQQHMPCYTNQQQMNYQQQFNQQQQYAAPVHQNMYRGQNIGQYQNNMDYQAQQSEFMQNSSLNMNQFAQNQTVQNQNQFGAQNQMNNYNAQPLQPSQMNSQGLNFSSKAFVPNSGAGNGQTINNITINNYCGNSDGEQQMNKNMFFPSLDSIKANVPTQEQANELANITQQNGGIKPLHKKAFNYEEKVEISECSTDENSEKKNFEFPDGGWECSKCQNYNFKGRKACFRCKKNKGDEDTEGKPVHMSTVMAKPRKNKKQKQEQVDDNSGYEYNKDNRVHKYKIMNTQARVGDWTCQRCFNHNFSFRDVCNMCYLSQQESNKMLYQQQQNSFMVSQGMNQQEFDQSQNSVFTQQF